MTQTRTLADQLTALGVPATRMHVIPPGIDPAWAPRPDRDLPSLRLRLGFEREDLVIAYFGSAAPLRGLPLLLESFEQARQEVPQLRLLVLSRVDRKAAAARGEKPSAPERQGVKWVEGWLPPEELAAHVAACDLVALPFELLPSDAPLSLLEARRLGKPIVTTRLACLPELAGEGAALAEPSDPASLARALAEMARALAETERAQVEPALTGRKTGEGDATQIASVEKGRGYGGQVPGARPWQSAQQEWLELASSL